MLVEKEDAILETFCEKVHQRGHGLALWCVHPQTWLNGFDSYLSNLDMNDYLMGLKHSNPISIIWPWISCCRIECESEPLLSITFRGQHFFFIFKGWWYSMELYKQSVASSKTKSIVGSKDSPFIGELGPGYKIKNYSIPTFPDCIIFPSLQIQFWLEWFLCRKKVEGPIGERGYKNKWNFTFNWYHLM